MLSGCETVTDIYLYNNDCTKISIGTQLLSGGPKDVVIRVPYESFGNYAADYFWSVYAGNSASSVCLTATDAVREKARRYKWAYSPNVQIPFSKKAETKEKRCFATCQE